MLTNGKHRCNGCHASSARLVVGAAAWIVALSLTAAWADEERPPAPPYEPTEHYTAQ